jgi:hypothetical protein
MFVLGSLNTYEQNRLAEKQYRQMIKRLYRSTKNKDKCLRLTFPIEYTRPRKSKRSMFTSCAAVPSASSFSSIDSLRQPTRSSELSTIADGVESSVSNSFDNENIDHRRERNPSTSFLSVPSKKSYSKAIRSFNASVDKDSCQGCGSILFNDVCLCIVSDLLEFNQKKDRLCSRFDQMRD